MSAITDPEEKKEKKLEPGTPLPGGDIYLRHFQHLHEEDVGL